MHCAACNNTVSSGLEIVLDELNMRELHCPFCLEPLADSGELDSDKRPEVQPWRTERRRALRERMLTRWRSTSGQQQSQCPECDRLLSAADERQFLAREYFRCHGCGHDLANVAYLQEAYDEQRWMPVVAAIADMSGDPKCAGCSYMAAAAKATERAFSHIPSVNSKRNLLLRSVQGRGSRNGQLCDSGDCVVVAQYRATAGQGLLVL